MHNLVGLVFTVDRKDRPQVVRSCVSKLTGKGSLGRDWHLTVVSIDTWEL